MSERLARRRSAAAVANFEPLLSADVRSRVACLLPEACFTRAGGLESRLRLLGEDDLADRLLDEIAAAQDLQMKVLPLARAEFHRIQLDARHWKLIQDARRGQPADR